MRLLSRLDPVTLSQWFLPRVLELTHAAWDLQPFVRDYGCAAAPFKWIEDRHLLPLLSRYQSGAQFGSP